MGGHDSYDAQILISLQRGNGQTNELQLVYSELNTVLENL